MLLPALMPMARQARRTAAIAAYAALTAVHAARVRELQALLAADPHDWLSACALKTAQQRYARATKALRRWHGAGQA